MDCENCYKNGHCWACVKWFGCRKEKPDEPSEETPEGCFKCDRANCPKKEDEK